ncbi:hypothetical protein K474DRAFT_1629835 [Panus rudis PR-1116 ss-1]|nr:hypothetical protein K474DRAFT_1629835 [Panus rudis PR-1116 ss-1]
MVQTDRRLLWHPRLDNRFLVGGGGQLTVYEWHSGSSEIKHVTSKHDLQMMRCFAWSPDLAFDDLVAVGHSNGRVDLMRLETTASSTNQILSGGPVVSLPVRNSRACNTLAFCQADPNYLAVGLDKVRSEFSLLIWDINTVKPNLVVKTLDQPATPIVEHTPRPHPPIPRGELAQRADQRLLQQHASAEVVSSLAWIPNSTNLLLAGVSQRWLRLFDLRIPNATTNIASKTQGIATDPFNAHIFGSFGDGVISIWDHRRLSTPILNFTEKDAAADGARPRANAGFSAIEFSSVRRGTLATLGREAYSVRFWDIRQAEIVSRSPEGRISRDSSQSTRGTRYSWANPSTMFGNWPHSGSSHASSPSTTHESSKVPYQLILADTRKTKNFNRSLASFALVPSSEACPLTSNVMVVNKEGDLELYAVHDIPTHTPWSPRGDLATGIGRSYRIFPGFHEREPPPEPWNILVEPSTPPFSADTVTNKEHPPESAPVSPPPTFGRGDEDGFPALVPNAPSSKPLANLAATRPGGVRTFSPAALRNFEHTTPATSKQSPATEHSHSHTRASHSNGSPGGAKGKVNHVHGKHGKDGLSASKHSVDVPIHHAIESDISMVMRRRVIRGYGLISAVHNSTIVKETTPDDTSLSDIWLWINHTQQLMSYPTSLVEGYNFAYQGIWGIWDGFRPSQTHISAHPTPRVPHRNLLDPPTTLASALNLDMKRTRSGSRHGGGGSGGGGSGGARRRSRPPSDVIIPDEFLGAIAVLNSRKESTGVDGGGGSSWQPSVPTAKLSQRQLALYLCGWNLAEEDLTYAIKRWEKEHRHSQAACWLVFTKQYKAAIDVLMRSKDETHHMMSGMLAALSPSSSNRNNELRDHCERLIVRLQDPYLRALLTHLTFNDDWTEVLAEEALPLRERLAIAIQFLNDKDLTSYLRRIMERCSHHGDIDGLIVTGLTTYGLDIIQTYVDITGDLQSAALLANLNPARARDARSERWLEQYRDMLDQWKLFHFRCQLDIDRGRILQDAIQHNEISPFEWTPRQIVLRCNYCNKPFTPPLPNNARPTSCVHCGRSLPRCSICLLTLSIVQDIPRNAELVRSNPKGTSNTIDEGLVFCQSCRHGGHASHILEWFYGEDGTRSHGSCPVANCHCRCADGF